MAHRYHVKDPGASHVAEIVWRPCNFGGSRPYFLCPLCRGGALFLNRTRYDWLCARCCRVSYPCQRETPRDRMLRRVRKIRAKVGGSMNTFESVWLKPKGMHQTTWQRILRELAEREAVMWGEAARRFKLRLP